MSATIHVYSGRNERAIAPLPKRCTVFIEPAEDGSEQWQVVTLYYGDAGFAARRTIVCYERSASRSFTKALALIKRYGETQITLITRGRNVSIIRDVTDTFGETGWFYGNQDQEHTLRLPQIKDPQVAA